MSSSHNADGAQTEANLYIVTERVVPLSWHVRRRSISEETAKWGLYTVSVGGSYTIWICETDSLREQSTLKFINEDASSVHGVVRASSVFTSESGEWKLGGFEVLSSMNDENAVIYVSPRLSSQEQSIDRCRPTAVLSPTLLDIHLQR